MNTFLQKIDTGGAKRSAPFVFMIHESNMFLLFRTTFEHIKVHVDATSVSTNIFQTEANNQKYQR